MKRFAAFVAILISIAVPARAVFAQTATPAAFKAAVKLRNPAKSHGYGPHSMTGQGCIAKAANTDTINPITGKAQATTIVSVPVSNGSGNVASATTHRQQSAACGHATH
jgi:hypothetical protein